ncbi:30S ribosomal protein S12 methylthiotransferase RimO [Anoxynatronum buryatiense]|uniref:Ribosomal protein uS12 methylthiotransferase RimO n=1 Tax=Anoxynatronum buryatiense TaxID=489973 RepID=A0AA45WUT0_9CLOT|nr:30S ribosomal protein S12 methylthiotransferase RimO [Anoxynatronum buryatiense]SMP47804.1 SSU ribosomal protein S12P methylthiotransferase [Anoxynatronum buryatiense]
MNTNKIYLESLGCTKNLIDAEMMLGLLQDYGYNVTDRIEEATIAVINTCGFIESAKEESISRILAAARHKQTTLSKLIVTGCLSERYHQELLNEMPEIDGMVGTGRFEEIAQVVENVMKEQRELRIGQIDQPYQEKLRRVRTSANHLAYLKIAEGCNHHCTYCIIPKLRGPLRSRRIEAVIQEASDLAAEGVKELILIAQDTTSYGIDLYHQPSLTRLLEELERIKGIRWIRIMYCYPERIDMKLLDTIHKSQKICAYLDIPIQHSEDRILKRMNRQTTRKKLIHTISMIREKIPGIVLRTTLIVGFPGETEEEFVSLKSFVEEMAFDKLGVFTYSQEEDTPAATMQEQVDEDTKKRRQQEIMQLQQSVSRRIQRNKIGSRLSVFVEEKLDSSDSNYHYAGRTTGDAPEIDGLVYFDAPHELETGTFVPVVITDALEYDLMGVMIDEAEPGK